MPPIRWNGPNVVWPMMYRIGQENKKTSLCASMNVLSSDFTSFDLSCDKLYLQSGSWEPPYDSQRPTVGRGRSWRTPHADLLGRSDSVPCGCTAGILWCGSFQGSCSRQKIGSLCSCNCLKTERAAAITGFRMDQFNNVAILSVYWIQKQMLDFCSFCKYYIYISWII